MAKSKSKPQQSSRQRKGCFREGNENGHKVRRFPARIGPDASSEGAGAGSRFTVPRSPTGPPTPGEAASFGPLASLADDIPLSTREREIVRLVAKGLPNKVIAGVLDISPWTVATHLRRIFAKLNVNSRAAMVTRIYELKSSHGTNSYESSRPRSALAR